LKVECVIPAKNEEKYLPDTLKSIMEQDMEIDRVVVVDDGSTDRTSEIALGMGAEVLSVSSQHVGRVVGPHVASLINKGLGTIRRDLPQYVLICGADDILQENYVSYLVEKMRENPLLVIASGSSTTDKAYRSIPRGVRVVFGAWWRDNKFRYEERPGWEELLCLSAVHTGCRATRFSQVRFRQARAAFTYKAPIDLGRSMKATGYPMYRAMLRAGKMYRARPDQMVRALISYVFETVPPKWVKNARRRYGW